MNSPPLIYRFFRVPKDSIHILKGLFESYEGMCVLSTIDRDACEIQLTVAADFADEMDAVVKDLQTRIALLEIARENRSLGHF